MLTVHWPTVKSLIQVYGLPSLFALLRTHTHTQPSLICDHHRVESMCVRVIENSGVFELTASFDSFRANWTHTRTHPATLTPQKWQHQHTDLVRNLAWQKQRNHNHPNWLIDRLTWISTRIICALCVGESIPFDSIPCHCRLDFSLDISINSKFYLQTLRMCSAEQPAFLLRQKIQLRMQYKSECD